MGKFKLHLSEASTTLKGFIVFLCLIGICLRILNLDHAVYAHGEVYTTLRAAGFTRQEINETLFQNQLISASDLQTFQHLKPDSTTTHTLQSLANEDPRYPPFYVLMARHWMQWFGSSIHASRALPVLLSLLSLPLMYGLGLELFAFPLAALLATMLLAISPLDSLLARTAQPFSLLTAVTLGSSWLLLRALRRATWLDWLWYALASALGLYTHPLFGLTLIAQGVYVGLRNLDAPTQYRLGSAARNRLKSPGLAYLGAIALTFLLYSPWLLVLIKHLGHNVPLLSWKQVSVSVISLLQLWFLNFTALFFDLNWGLNNPLTFIVRLPILLIILAALALVCLRTPRISWLFILTLLLVPFLVLALPDIATGGGQSTIPHRLLVTYPAIQLAVGYWLAVHLQKGQWVWRSLTVLLVTGSLVSCGMNTLVSTGKYQEPSTSNAATVRQVNSLTAPILVSDVGDDLTNAGNLIALSYRLDNTVKLLLLDQPPDLTRLDRQAGNLLAFRPSTSLQQALTQHRWQIGDPLVEGEQLWPLQR